MIFEWDDIKAETNKKKHGVSFAEAATVFSDPNAIELRDEDHSDKEDRWVLVGLFIKQSSPYPCFFVEKEDTLIRIISARKAIKDETDQNFARMIK